MSPLTDITLDPRSWWRSLRRGLRGRCPSCGEGVIFKSYLKVVDRCDICGEALGRIRADDAPPYFTILIVGHIVVPLLLVTDRLFTPPLILSMIAWPSVTVVLTLLLLPRVKGALLGFMWALKIGTDEHVDAEPAPHP